MLVACCLSGVDRRISIFFFFFFNDTATTEIYTLSLHDALPIYPCPVGRPPSAGVVVGGVVGELGNRTSVQRRRVKLTEDRKSTRLNSSHLVISYAVFCLKKKKKKQIEQIHCVSNYRVYTITLVP